VAVHAGLQTGPESRDAAQAWIETEMSKDAVVGKFEALISEGLRKRPPRPRITGGRPGPRPSLSDDRPAARPYTARGSPVPDLGANSDPAYQVQYYETWDARQFALSQAEYQIVMSERFTINEDVLQAALNLAGQAKEGDIIILVSQRKNGDLFPLADEVQKGEIGDFPTVLLRRKCLAPWVKVGKRESKLRLRALLLEALRGSRQTRCEMKHMAQIAASEPSPEPEQPPSTGLRSVDIPAI